MRKFFMLFIVVGLLAISFARVGAQTSPTFDVVLPDAPGGFSGGIVRVELMQGAQGTFLDANCSGGIPEFSDVVALFISVATSNPLADCRSVGNIFTISGVTFPDFGLDTVNDQGLDFIEFAVADGNQLIEPDATDSLIATVELSRVSEGGASIFVRWIAFDDEVGVSVPQPVIKGFVR